MTCVCVYVYRCPSWENGEGMGRRGGVLSAHRTSERQHCKGPGGQASRRAAGSTAKKAKADRQAGTGSLHSRGPLWPWGPRRWGSAHDTNGGDSRLRVNEDYGLGED